MKNILVSGYIGFNNFGDEAIFYALSNHLKSLNHKVSVLCNNKKEVAKKYKVKSYYYKNPLEILWAILNCNILISGGGSLLQNKTSNSSLFYYLCIILLAKLCFKKVVIFAQGIEPIIGKKPELITKTILKMVDFISVRDNNSRKLLKSWGINSTLVSDPAYALAQNTKISDKKEGLIVQLRSFKGMTKEFLSSLAFSISKNFQKDISVFSFQNELDEKICFDFLEELKKYNIQANYISNKEIDETINILNNAKYVISTRLHGLIVANALNSNTFAICYDEKIKTLVNELNLKSIDIFNYKAEELDNKLDEFFNHCLNEVHPYRKFEWENIDKELNK
ncbi:MAG: polysaccharide pyruvyl transferase CsaB [Candidatus Gastranaerophilales bacterium]|nr:polysaccharide pyruvyl transferase CsaB [Candidatus Gastranaerophilales bacterium]